MNIPNRLSSVFQSEVGINIDSFSSAVENNMRQAPDIILMGEMRDKPSISGGLEAAETGHLVFATGHTDGASDALERFAGKFEGDEKHDKLQLLARTTKAVIFQLLVKSRLGGRIPVQEILIIDSPLRIKLLAAIANKKSLSLILRDHLETK